MRDTEIASTSTAELNTHLLFINKFGWLPIRSPYKLLVGDKIPIRDIVISIIGEMSESELAEIAIFSITNRLPVIPGHYYYKGMLD